MMRTLGILAGLLALAGCGESGMRGQDAERRTLNDTSGLGCAVAAALPDGGITAVDTSLTPRPNRGAEVLAMEASGGFIAPEDLYQRVVADLAAMGLDGGGGLGLGCGTTPNRLIVNMSAAGAQQVASGQYTAWDEYNAALHLTGIERLGENSEYFVLQFDGVYNDAALAAAYADLPEIDSAGPDGIIGAAGDACLERNEDTDTNQYIFWTGSGDCPAGCTEHHYRGVAVTAGGGVVELGTYDGDGTPPSWFTAARACRAFLYPQT